MKIRFPRHGAVHASTALWRCSWAVLLAACVADAGTLRHRGAAVEQAVATPSGEKTADPCTVWLQEHAGQAHSAGLGQAPCPCLNTPPPLMSPEEYHRMQVEAAADNAMLKGLTRIQEAAVAAAKPIEEELNKVSVKDVEEMAKKELEGAEKNQTESLKLTLEAEKTRQEKEMADMEESENMVAKLTSDHVRQTAEEYAKNQARNQLFHKAKGPMAEAVEKSEKTEAIRQKAVEVTMGTLKSAANALGVAKKAQAAIAMVPEDAMSNAIAASRKSKKEQVLLNSEIASVEASVRQMAQMANNGYAMAVRTLEEAKASELLARKALETSRGNALKIEKLKTRAADIGARVKATSQN